MITDIQIHKCDLHLLVVGLTKILKVDDTQCCQMYKITGTIHLHDLRSMDQYNSSGRQFSL